MRRFPYQPLWLSLYFPDLPIEQLRAQDSLHAIAEKQRIVFVSPAASAVDIRADMRLATAFALQPELKVSDRKLEQEARALQALSEWAYQFTPTVMPYKHFSVVLEIGGSLSLFKGLSRLRQQIRQGLERQGYRCVEGLAHTREGAWLMSRFRAEQSAALFPGEINEFSPPAGDYWLPLLHSLPLHCLDLETKQQKQLLNMGLSTLGALAALPRKELGRRFGQGILKLMEDVLGETAKPSRDFRPAKSFSTQVDFASGLSSLEDINAPMENLLLQLLHFLHQQHCQVQSLEWQFFYFKHKTDKLLLHVSPANNTLASLLSLSRLKLEHFALKAPLESLGLHSDDFRPAELSSGELFPELSHPSTRSRDYRQLLDKLATRLGDSGLTTLALEDEHLPEYQQQLRSLTPETLDELGKNSEHRPPLLGGTKSMPLPLWLTREAQPIAAPGQSGSLRIIYGPQRIDSHWWQTRAQRDYFIARHRNGAYCWVFQDLKSRRWYVQGFYG